MSELKATTVYDAYWKANSVGEGTGVLVYLKSEADAELRRLQRALWLARALRARDIQRWWIAVTCAPKTERACRVWNNVEHKCRAKAEEYK